METSDEADARAFWDYMQLTTGARAASWNTFSAMFETHMRRHYSAAMALLPAATPAEMVLRYAFDRGNPARATAGEHVTPRHLALFLRRFGPMRSCLVKAARSLFDESGCLVPWFHGSMSRNEATRAIEDWEASRGDGSQLGGVFLFRYSDRPVQPAISFSYRRMDNLRMMRCLINNNGTTGYVLAGVHQSWQDLREFVREQSQVFVHPVPSALHLECSQEIEARRLEEEHARTPENEIADIRQLFGEAQALVYGDIGEGMEATRVLEEALEIVREVDSRLRHSELGEPQLQAKALRLGGDILWKLRREGEGASSYRRCLTVVAKAEERLDVLHEDSPVVTASMLSHVHQLLAGYYLGLEAPGKALHHFSELIACTTDEEARRQLVEDFRKSESFERATAGLTHASVEAMLDEGIVYFRRQEYEPAWEKFEEVLRDARCIGEGSVEARALGNLATVDFKSQRIPAAIRRYRMCVQLLRQQGNQVTEAKILNYLVLCCIEAQRWTPAKLFHEQLSKLAVSEENIEHLARLADRIQSGMDMQARQQEAAAHLDLSGGGGGGGGGGGSSEDSKDHSPPPPLPRYIPYRR